MFMNVFKVRAVWAIAGLVVMIGYLATGGSFGSRNTILIEFGMYPEDFAGMQVEIDGEIAGTLTQYGQATRNAFSVKDGTHRVALRDPRFASHVETVTLGEETGQVMLIADFIGERDGKPVIGFQ